MTYDEHGAFGNIPPPPSMCYEGLTLTARMTTCRNWKGTVCSGLYLDAPLRACGPNGPAGQAVAADETRRQGYETRDPGRRSGLFGPGCVSNNKAWNFPLLSTQHTGMYREDILPTMFRVHARKLQAFTDTIHISHSEHHCNLIQLTKQQQQKQQSPLVAKYESSAR
jgi:hypothetical protein